MGAVAFIDDLLEVADALVGRFLDGAFNVFLRHRFGAGLGHQGAQAGVAGHVRSALLDGNGDFLSEFREDAGHVAPSLQFPFLTEFKRSSHTYSAILMRLMYLSMS